MKAQVQLPNDKLIDWWDFCKAIAEAICPASEKNLVGIECIVGTLIKVRVASATRSREENKNPGPLPSITLDNERSVFEEQPMDETGVSDPSIHHSVTGAVVDLELEEMSLPYKLTSDNRRLMEELLPALPTLQYPLSEKDVSEFMSAYFALPHRPTWEPLLVTAETLKRRKIEQDEIMRQHQKSLQEELTKGRIVAVNRINVPVTRLFIGDSIPRAQAIAYLERCGIQYADSTNEISEQINDLSEVGDAQSNVVGGIKRKLTEAQRQEVVSEYRRLLLSGEPRYCEITAKKFNISTSYVRRLVNKEKLKMTPNNLSQNWVRKP